MQPTREEDDGQANGRRHPTSKHLRLRASAGRPPTPPPTTTIRFYDYSYDPGHQGIATRRWEFGDGTLSDEAQPEHRYGADGEYDVTLTTSTLTGWSCTYVQAFRVRTRHVSITSFTTPHRCTRGQRADVTIGIASAQRDEIVDVVLRQAHGRARSVLGGATQPVDRDRARRLSWRRDARDGPRYVLSRRRDVRFGHARGKNLDPGCPRPCPFRPQRRRPRSGHRRGALACRLVVC